jgi:RNA polymerase sigma-70 factor (ECF subfamily)
VTGKEAPMRDEEATEVFLGHRELLFSIVYNLLGSVADTEDVLQETWLSWNRRLRKASGAEIENPRAYLVRIAVNQALSRQTAISRRKETYVGTWLPEPLVTEADDRVESVSMALLVVMETLSPLERAVFVLHEVFGYQHTEIAGILGRTPSAVRQLAHRAHEHVQARRPRYTADPRVQQAATERFVAALFGADLEELLKVLAPEVTLWTDGGGKATAAGLHPVYGRERVARVLANIAANRTFPAVEIRFRRVNGDPSALLFAGEAPFAAIVVDLAPDGDHVQDIYAVTNPDKLSGVPVRPD